MQEGTVMTTAQVGYLPVHRWVKHVLGRTHTTVVVTVAWAVLCLLTAQRVTAAALARALPAEHAGSGRSCLRRGRRWWSGPVLDQATISPALIRLALTLLAAAQPVVVALDTPRLGPWEVWWAGIVIAGGTLPIGWAVIAYAWPKGRFRATPLALIQQLQQAFPVGVRWTLVADRGFPSAVLFAQLRRGGPDCSVRLRWSDWVTGRQGLRDRPCTSECREGGRRTADSRDDRAGHRGAAPRLGCYRCERRGGDAATP
jgi:hypothetical protein